MTSRGSYGFELQPDGRLTSNEHNLTQLRKLLLDAAIVNGKLGPGRSGDFDHGSWHIMCHLAAGSAAYRSDEEYLWAGLTHEGDDRYIATLNSSEGGRLITEPLLSERARAKLGRARLLGFLEGSSRGHILASGVSDPDTAFNRWPRQDFDQDQNSDEDGGPVWELWCVTRDILPESKVGTSVLSAYLDLISVCGGQLVAAVGRGRRSYNHPDQICGLVKAGVLTRPEALWATSPLRIPATVQPVLQNATPATFLEAVRQLPWPDSGPCYFMYERKIDDWNPVDNERRILDAAGA